MQREIWVKRYTERLWEYHPQHDSMWDMDHLGPWIEDDEIEALMMQCPDDPERAAGVIFDQVVEEMEMHGEVYSPPMQHAVKTAAWKTCLTKFLPAVFWRK